MSFQGIRDALGNVSAALEFIKREIEDSERNSRECFAKRRALKEENNNLLGKALLALQQQPETLGKLLKQKVLLDALGIKPDMLPYPTQKPAVAIPKTESEAKGHSAQHHGLQKHSVGDIYPWAIVGIGNGAVVHYELHNLVTDERVCRKVAGEDVVLGFRDTHSYVNACLQAVLERGMDVSLGAYIAKPAPKDTSRR